MKAFNLNNRVKVILTAAGAKILNEKNLELRDRLKSIVGSTYNPPLYGENDIYCTQLWCLMEDFGPEIHITSEPFFKNNNIYLGD